MNMPVTQFFTLGINCMALGVTADRAVIVLRRATSNDSFSVIPDYKQTFRLTDGRTSIPLLKNTTGSVYEITLYNGSSQVLSGMFEMPAQDTYLHLMQIHTSWPPFDDVIATKQYAMQAVRAAETAADDAAQLLNGHYDANVRPQLLDALNRATAAANTAEAAAETEVAGLRTDLQETGSNFLAYQRDSTRQPAKRTQREKSDERLDVRDFNGCDLKGNHDNTSVIQGGIDESADFGTPLNIPGGKLVATATITPKPGCHIRGMHSAAAYQLAYPKGRTIIHLAHNGNGFQLDDMSNGLTIENLVTLRDQPQVPASSSTTPWQPNLDMGWDFVFFEAQDINLHNIHLTNATRGVICHGQRFNFGRITGLPLVEGIRIVCAYDVCRMSNVHFWPFGMISPHVQKWLQNNATAFTSMRNDNPMFSRLFTIWYKIAMFIDFYDGQGQGGSPNRVGSTAKLKLTDCDFDLGRHAYYVSPRVNGHTAIISNLSSQGMDVPEASAPIQINGNGCNLVLSNPHITYAGANSIRVEGTGNTINISNPSLFGWDMVGKGFPALEAVPGNAFNVAGTLQLVPHPGKSTAILPGFTAGESKYQIPITRSFPLEVTAQQGTIGEIRVYSSAFRLVDNRCMVNVDFEVIDAGTAAGSLIFKLPRKAQGVAAVGSGREITKNGKQIAVTVRAGVSSAEITNYDGTYPGVTEARLIATVEYETEL